MQRLCQQRYLNRRNVCVNSTYRVYTAASAYTCIQVHRFTESFKLCKLSLQRYRIMLATLYYTRNIIHVNLLKFNRSIRQNQPVTHNQLLHDTTSEQYVDKQVSSISVNVEGNRIRRKYGNISQSFTKSNSKRK